MILHVTFVIIVFCVPVKYILTITTKIMLLMIIITVTIGLRLLNKYIFILFILFHFHTKGTHFTETLYKIYIQLKTWNYKDTIL